MAVLQVCLLSLFVVCTTSSYMFSNTIIINNGAYNVSYNFNESADTLEFLVEASATGWVGFGFSLNASATGMVGYDVAVGGVLSNGTGYLRDYFTDGTKQPPEDSQQDWVLINSTEQSGVTTLKFYRKRNTSDSNDIAIEQGVQVYIVWAYHSTDDVDPDSGMFSRHTGEKGVEGPVTLIPTIASMTTSEMPAMVTTTEAEVSTPALLAMTTSTMAAMTTSAVIEVGPSTMVEMTTSAMEEMTTSALTEVGTSTMVEMTTTTMGAMTASPLATSNTPAMIIEPTTATTAVATSSPVATASPGPSQHFANFRSLDNGNYNVSWMFNSSMDSLHFTVEVRATGWVGFGVATQAPNNMTYYDVAVGGVVNGSGYLKDYLTRGFGPPPEDTKQDWVLTYSREDNGITTLQFYRKLNTSDANDTVIQQEVPIFLIWAYHRTNDVQTGQFMKHSYRGFMQIILISAPTTPGTPTNPPAQTTPSTPTNPPAQPTPTMFPLSFDNDRFLVFWRFDDQNDNIFIHLRVKTTGWIGFGFAETAPSNMMNYDVIVGGYNNGQGYLNDSFTSGQTQPPPDASQDYRLLNASEVGGYTELMFERRRDTGDNDNDLTFMPGGQFYFVWAYHTGDVTDISNFQKHSRSGVSPEKYTVIPAKQPIPTEAAAPSLQHSSICGLFSLLVAMINVFSLSS